MLRRIDSSEWLSKLLVDISSYVSRYRGLPLIVGFGFIIASLLIFGLVILSLVLAEVAETAYLWFCLPIACLHIGLIIFFIGVMSSTPLGAGYHSSDR